MKKSASDIVLTVFKILLLVAVTVYLAYCIIGMATTKQETGWEALGFVILLVFGFYVNGGALILSTVFLIVSIVSKSSFVKNNEITAEGYEANLKRKKHHILHYLLLMAYTVISEIIIFIVGSIIF